MRSLSPGFGKGLYETKWSKGARLVREDGTPVRASDLAVGSIITVFPDGFISDANSQTLLLRVPVGTIQSSPARRTWTPQGYAAFLKVCTHAGCRLVCTWLPNTSCSDHFYPAVGDRVPARVHRLDYLHRSMRLDVAASDWVRANTDSISARSTWRAARAIVTKAGADRQGAAYTGALNAVQDAITARSEPRFSRAIARADRSLGSVEKAIDTGEPPWRRFLHRVGF